MDPQLAAAQAPANGSNGSGAGHGTEKLHGAPEPTSKDENDAAVLTAPLVNAAAWWNLLHDQFKQAVGNAMTTEVTPHVAASTEKAKESERKKKEKTIGATSTTSTTGTARNRKTSK